MCSWPLLKQLMIFMTENDSKALLKFSSITEITDVTLLQ